MHVFHVKVNGVIGEIAVPNVVEGFKEKHIQLLEKLDQVEKVVHTLVVIGKNNHVILMHVFHVKVNGVPGRTCNRQCGGGVQEKTYTVTREAGPGGESCDHATGDTASRGCNTDDIRHVRVDGITLLLLTQQHLCKVVLYHVVVVH